MHSPEHITTPRLALRRFTAADVDLLGRWHSDPAVMRYLGGTLPRDKTEAMLRERILDYYEQHPGLGIWATVERGSGVCVGMHLLNHIQGEALIQVGYVLAADYWGRGYATEMCIALLRYGFVKLGLAQLVAITNRDNLPSQRVLLKAGLHRHGERAFAHPAYAEASPLAWFTRDRADWLAEQAPSGHTD